MMSNLKNKLIFVLALVVAAAVGGITTSVVRATIPGDSGVIHGCVKNGTGTLRAVDSDNGYMCYNNETPLDWDQEGGAQAYAHIAYNTGTEKYALEASRSKRIKSLHYDPDTGAICLTSEVPPKNVNFSINNGGPFAFGIKDEKGWTEPMGSYCNSFPESNIYVNSPPTDFFISVN